MSFQVDDISCMDGAMTSLTFDSATLFNRFDGELVITLYFSFVQLLGAEKQVKSKLGLLLAPLVCQQDMN